MSPQLLGHLAMLAFSALVAGSFSLGSLVANDIAPAALNAVRFVLAAAVIGAVLLGVAGVFRQARSKHLGVMQCWEGSSDFTL